MKHKTIRSLFKNSMFLTALTAATLGGVQQAQAKLGLQSFEASVQGVRPDGKTIIAVHLTYTRTERPIIPMQLDLGDGSPMIPLIDPADPDELGDTTSVLPLARHDVLGLDMNLFRTVERTIYHKFPDGMEESTFRVTGDQTLHSDVINHDDEWIRLEWKQRLKPLEGDSLGQVRANDPAILALTPDTRHSYDLPKAWVNDQPGYRCRLLTAEESRINSIPTVNGNELRITEDCKIQWDTTGAKVGERYAFSYRAENGKGLEWTTLQTIQIVEDLDSICSVTPGYMKRDAFPVPNQSDSSEIRFRIPRNGREESVFRFSGGHAEPGVTTTAGVNTLGYEIRTGMDSLNPQSAGKYLGAISVSHIDPLPKDEPSYCPIVVEHTCENRPEADRDGDGVCDAVDNCPDNGSSTDQWDSDGDGVGDLCDPDIVNDQDGDGVSDEEDRCPDTSTGEVTNARGCSVMDRCACPETIWEETLVECVERVSRRFKRKGLIDADARQTLIQEAEATTCPEVGAGFGDNWWGWGGWGSWWL